MPQYTGFASGDWISIISIIVSFLVTIAVQSWVFFKWQTAQFQKADDKLEVETAARNIQAEALKDRIVAERDSRLRETARLDRENEKTKHELAIALASLPTRDSIEAMFVARVQPLEASLHALVIELARSGIPSVGGRRRDE
jgi:hypothetical protein